jgi:hypothetical protein
VERTEIVVAAVRDAVAVLEAAVWQAAPVLLDGDLLAAERALQRVGRQALGTLTSRVLAARAAGPEGEARRCPQCERRLHVVGRERERTVVGLVGEYRFARPTFYCAHCRACHAPLDAVLGLGAGQLSPGLAQVACEQAQKDSFAEASRSVRTSVGVAVAEETIRRVAEDVGRLIEHEQADVRQWALPRGAEPAQAVIEADGVLAPLRDGYHEGKVGRVAVLGPQTREDTETGRQLLVLGASTYCVGFEPAEAFFARLLREAERAGVRRGVRLVVCLGDGARWIWQRMRTAFSLPGAEVVEIVDFRHASAHLYEVAAAVYGEGSVAALTWWHDQKHRLLHEGPAPILAELGRLLARPDLEEPAQKTVRRNLEEFFADNVARMAYPAFVARALPIGSGAVESACKVLVSKRQKGAGMRWTQPGAQAIASLRALYSSAHGRWDVFWASKPLHRLRLLPHAAAAPSTAPAAAASPASVAPSPPTLAAPTPPSSATAPTPPAGTAHIATAGKPWAKGKDHWRRTPICHPRSA